MRTRALVLTLVTAAGLLAAWWFLAGGDAETAIRRRLDDVAQTASRRPDEADVLSLAKLRALGDVLEPDVEAADVRSGSVVRGRSEALRAVAWARDVPGEVTFAFEDVEIEVHDDDRADSRLVVRVEGSDPHGLDGTTATLSWVRSAGGWRIAQAAVERPAGSP